MNFKLLNHNEIDFEKWDKAILLSATPLVFAQAFYLNATCPNWKALVLNDYEVVMPITERKKLNIKYLYQPPFTPQLGVFGKCNKALFDLFLNFVSTHYAFIEIELNYSNSLFYQSVNTKNTYVIDLKETIHLNDNTKRNVAKAKKANVFIKEINEQAEIHKLTKIHLLSWLTEEIGVPEKDCKLFKQLIINSVQLNYLKMFAAYTQKGELLSIGYFISNGKYAVYLKGMSLNKKDNLGSMHMLMLHAITYYKEKADTFDFGGGNTKGMANFYKGFGGTAQTYNMLKVNNLKWPLNKLKK